MLFAFYLYQTGKIERHYMEDCFKMAGAAIGFVTGWYLERTTLSFSTESTGGKKQLMGRFIVGMVLTLLFVSRP